MSIGILGEYLGRMYEEIKGRPLYVIEEERNFVVYDISNGDSVMSRDSAPEFIVQQSYFVKRNHVNKEE